MANNQATPKYSFNLKKFITVSLHSWPAYVFSVLACLFLAGVYTIMRPPKDEVLAQLMLKDDSGGGSMMLAGQIARSFSLGDMFGGSSTTDNETFVMQSHTVFLQTARQMGLNTTYYARPLGILSRQVTSEVPYRLTAPVGVADTLSKTLVFDIRHLDNEKFDIKVKVKRKVICKVTDQTLPVRMVTDYGDFVIDKTEYFDPETIGSKFRITFSSYDGAASAYAKLVNIYVPDRKSDFIDLSFATNDAAFGKDLLDHLIRNYINISNVYKLERSNESLRLVDNRLASLANELLKSEGDLEKFKESNKLTDVEADATYLMTKTGNVEAQLLQAQTNYEVIKLTRDFITNPENNYSLIPDLFTATGSESGTAISQYNQLILERMELTSSAKENNSSVRQLDQQIDALRSNIITSIDRMYQNAAVSLRDLKDEDSRNKSRLGSLPAIEREYLVLKRDNMLQEQIYLFLLQQREELNMSLASRAFPAQVIDYPYVLPDPAGFTRKMVLALGFILGLMIAAVYVYLVKMRRHPITSLADFDTSIKVPAFTSLNADGATGSALAAGTSNADALRHLRSDVQMALKGCDGKVVAVTSWHAGEGKTYVAVNLAKALALTGAKVVLVDASLRSPQDARMLGIANPTNALAAYVHSSAASPQVVNMAVGEHASLDVITSIPGYEAAADVVANRRLNDLMAYLRDNYDYVVIDSERIDGYSDIFYITDVADLTLVVCRSGKLSDDDISQLNELYTEGRLKRMAVVKNAFK